MMNENEKADRLTANSRSVRRNVIGLSTVIILVDLIGYDIGKISLFGLPPIEETGSNSEPIIFGALKIALIYQIAELFLLSLQENWWGHFLTFWQKIRYYLNKYKLCNLIKDDFYNFCSSKKNRFYGYANSTPSSLKSDKERDYGRFTYNVIGIFLAFIRIFIEFIPPFGLGFFALWLLFSGCMEHPH